MKTEFGKKVYIKTNSYQGVRHGSSGWQRKISIRDSHNGDEPEDMYPIMADVLSAGFDYIPAKVLKRIIARYKK